MKQTHRLRLTLDFTITIDDTDLQSGATARDRADNARQMRLLQAILTDEKKLQSYLHYQLASHLSLISEGDWHELIREEGADDIADVVKPAIATLPKVDQRFFEDVEKHGVLYENLMGMDSCFSTELESSALVIVEDEQGSEAGQ